MDDKIKCLKTGLKDFHSSRDAQLPKYILQEMNNVAACSLMGTCEFGLSYYIGQLVNSTITILDEAKQFQFPKSKIKSRSCSFDLLKNLILCDIRLQRMASSA